MAEQQSAREHFDRQASHYDGQWNVWSEESLAWLINEGQFSRTDRVLDVATGTGFTALAVARLAGTVTGVDVSTGMLSEAEARARDSGCTNVQFRQAAAESLPFRDASFEAVTCRMAPHHFLSVPQFLAEAYRVVGPAGRLLIADTTVPDREPEIDEWQNRVETLRDSSHQRNYSPGEWEDLVRAAGFVLQKLDSHSGSVPITLNAWIRKGGCSAANEAQVRAMFAAASPAIRDALTIHELPGGDTGFRWMRVAISARRP